MEETLITYDTAVLAKQVGFDIPVLNYYHKYSEYKESLTEVITELDEETTIIQHSDLILENCNDKDDFPYCYVSAPTQSLLQKWLRKKHKIYVSGNVNIYTLKHSYEVFKYNGVDKHCTILTYSNDTNDWDLEYEEALEQGLYQALILIKNEQSNS